jgi:CRP-like cAMP-binding protein
MTAEIKKALATIELFRPLPATAIDQLAAFALIRTVRAGETIFCQGEPSPYCFGVLSGEVQIQRVSKDRRFAPKVLSVLGPGSLFGESSFFEESPRAAMASASQDGKLVGLIGPKLREWLKREPAVGQEVLMGMLKSSLERLQQTSGDLSVIYGLARLLGSGQSFDEALTASLDFVKNSIDGLDEVIFYERSAYWEEFEPVRALPHSSEIQALPVTHALVQAAQSAAGTFLLKSPELRQSLGDAKISWNEFASIALVPLLDREKNNHPLEGMLLLGSHKNAEVFSSNIFLLLSAISSQFAETLSRHRRQNEVQAQERLHQSRGSYNPKA